ncbi:MULTISPECIES: type IVB secretion system protein IcmH/DotU [Chromobacterium]|uniref:Type IVB secretion system protein IcmH/DotU n=1 Tax=Chromobacterium aquaticum TaxID=467180 RepID=A0ABV8ZXU0_9NEIS|nr:MULTISPECIES: type IVB secretion system protein IcmH/DotU [Chromobacterium]KMN35524.1 type VI secretion system protein ImpK [Chromobacterium sp. LK1]MCD5363304.1 type IVB secretion system protein IcmH/DotU [Chromobacterium aquaticum]
MNQTAATPQERPLAVAAAAAPTLREMLEDGIYLLFLLKDGNAPSSAVEFNRRVDQFLNQYERNARNFGKDQNAINHSKYAFCALMDEIILSSEFDIRDEWERMPLQLRLFGEHLAGEGFFNRLEQLRLEPATHIEPLEVFYTCLLLGFQGKYLLEGQEKLGYLTHKLGQEIQQVRGGKAEFAPNWQLPQRFQAFVRHELPLWLYFALLAVVGAGIFVAYRWLLSSQMQSIFGL